MSFTSLLNRQGSQSRYTETQNSFGEEEKTWQVIQADFKCRVQKTDINQRNIDLVKGGIGSYVLADYTIYALPEEDVIDNDEITVDGVKYKVLKAQKDSSQHHWELKCEIVN
jgi:hypothetical protein